jgi:hypothetical protein
MEDHLDFALYMKIGIFIEDHMKLGIRRLVILYEEQNAQTTQYLLEQGVSREEIDFRVKRSNQFFDGRISEVYVTKNSLKTPEEIADFKAKSKALAVQHSAENKSAVVEFDIRNLDQTIVHDLLSRRRQKFSISESTTAKVLLICVSYDEDEIRQRCIDIVSYFNTGHVKNIEFFVTNPEEYGPPRVNHKTWIPRDHYFQLPFGDNINPSQYPDYHRLIENGPYEFISYVGCPIYDSLKVKGVGDDFNSEGPLLNTLMGEDSILIIDTFKYIPRFMVLALRSVNIELMGKVDVGPFQIGMFMKAIGN